MTTFTKTLAMIAAVATLAAVTSTQASAGCGSESRSSYGDTYYSADSDNAGDSEGEGFRGGFERHNRFEHRDFERRNISVSKVIRRQ